MGRYYGQIPWALPMAVGCRPYRAWGFLFRMQFLFFWRSTYRRIRGRCPWLLDVAPAGLGGFYFGLYFYFFGAQLMAKSHWRCAWLLDFAPTGLEGFYSGFHAINFFGIKNLPLPKMLSWV